ncbi:MAG: hypothetical protein H6815_04605 [Phycisphaeraceae bacterium]|nr:hypothetical protein [Phycisphaerales bacterium]MCB9859714.1 hypothetical protein [Phycisphaeraceae bacterium]
MKLLRSVMMIVFSVILTLSSARAQQPIGQWQPGPKASSVSGSIYSIETWDPDGSGPAPQHFAIGGRIDAIGSEYINNIAMWDGTSWQQMGDGFVPPFSEELGGLQLKRIGNTLFAGVTAGNATTGFSHSLKQWNGNAWAEVPSSTWFAASNRFTVFRHENKLAVYARNDEMPSEQYVIGLWDGVGWSYPVTVPAGVQLFKRAVELKGYWYFLVNKSVYRLNADGTTTEVGVATEPYYPNVSAMEVFNNEIYITGLFHEWNDVPRNSIVRFDGTSWSPVGVGLSGDGSLLRVGNDRIYVAGPVGSGINPDGSVVPSSGFLSWNGTSWKNESSEPVLSPFDLSIDGDIQFARGGFQGTNPVFFNSLATRTNNAWQVVTTLSSTTLNGTAYSTCEYNDKLVVAGSFDYAGGLHIGHVATWDGTMWRSMNYPSSANAPGQLLEHNGVLYTSTSGPSGSTGNYPVLYHFIGTTWIPDYYYGYQVAVRSMAVYEDSLVVAGRFTQPSVAIASQNGNTFAGGLNIGLTQYVQHIAVLGDDLYAWGSFASSVSGVPLNGFAKWDGSQWSEPPLPTLEVGSRPLVANDRIYMYGFDQQAGLVHISAFDGASWEVLYSTPTTTRLFYPSALVWHDDALHAAGTVYPNYPISFERYVDVRRFGPNGLLSSVSEPLYAPNTTIAQINNAMSRGNSIWVTGQFLGSQSVMCERIAELRFTCYPDCDGSGSLNIFDYICFGNAFSSNDPYADCDGSGNLNIFDYICFGNAYAAGCP